MAELTLTELDMTLLVGAIALFAGAVRGFTGFGGPAIMIVVLTQFYSPASVLAMVMMIDFVSNVRLVPTSFRDISWRTAGPLTAASVAAIPIGLYALLAVDPMVMKRVIAAVVALSALALLAGWRYRRPATVAALIVVGGLAGMVLGATYIALVAMVFLYAGPEPATTNRANGIFWGFVAGIVMIGVLCVTGDIVWADMWRAAMLGVVYLFAANFGIWVFRGVDEQVFRRFVLWLLIGLSAIGILF